MFRGRAEAEEDDSVLVERSIGAGLVVRYGFFSEKGQRFAQLNLAKLWHLEQNNCRI